MKGGKTREAIGRAFQGESDPYWAHKDLTEDQKLPDSDLLKAIHTYASDFYDRNFGEQAQADFHSLDETALLSLGILLEEMADQALGETGDLALTEGEVGESTVSETESVGSESASDISMEESEARSAPIESVAVEETLPSRPKSSKRRKIKHDGEGP